MARYRAHFLSLEIPGFGSLRIENLVLDFNGTLAIDGRLIPGVKPRIRRLARRLKIHVLTADTHATARDALNGLPCQTKVLAAAGQHLAKRRYVQHLGAMQTACIGNGRNDRLMLKTAALGIAVLQAEGTSREALLAADLVMPDIVDALEAFNHPLRLVASLRS
jgi:P-type E1-E2 ATPase